MSSLSLNFKNCKSVFTVHLFMYFFALTGLEHHWHKFAEKEQGNSKQRSNQNKHSRLCFSQQKLRSNGISNLNVYTVSVLQGYIVIICGLCSLIL